MTGDMIAQIAFLALLGAALLGWYFAEMRQNLGVVAKQAIAWVLIFIAVIAAIGLWQDIRPLLGQRSEGTMVEVPRRADGHFHLILQVEGEAIEFLVDTGATGIVLSKRDARRIGRDPEDLAYFGTAQTANGVVRTAQVTLREIAVGDIRDENVTAYVNEGALFGSLLGMDYLQRFARVTIEGDRLILER